MKKVLITGGNGLIGTKLQALLLSKGYEVNIIGRSDPKDKNLEIGYFKWDVDAQKMDIKSLAGVDAIIHLAGAGIADKHWTDARKKEIIDSRINSTRLLYDTLAHHKHQVQTIISASAVGYYGDCGAEVLTEIHAPGATFLAEVTTSWEREVSRIEELGIRHVCCRIGIVLSLEGGALPELVKTLPVGVAGYFSKADLYYSWIHIDDVCGIMIHAIENEKMKGSYNTTAPGPVLIKDLMKAILSAKKSKAILMPVPPFALKIALGQMSEAVLQSQRCSDKKIGDAGYVFRFKKLSEALKDIFKKSMNA
jgi:uncharacterized protein (TIGR01777 family)